MARYVRFIVHGVILGYAVYVVLTQRTEPPDLSLYANPTQNICQFLIDTDNELVKRYSERGKGQGEHMMDLLEKYNDNLAILVKRMVREKNRNETLITLSEAQSLVDHGGPEFINFYVDRPILEKDFGLNNISSRIMLGQRQNAIDIWQDFFRLTKKIPDNGDEDILEV